MSISLVPPPGTTRDPLYPDSDGKPMGETEYHILAITHLYDVLRPWFHAREGFHVAANMLLYYEQGNPSAVRGPDVMVSKGVRGKHLRRSFRVWEEGVVPAAVIEITSNSTKGEDQFDKPALYARLGVKEYFLFDPTGEYLRPRLQGFRLDKGVYAPMDPATADRISSSELGLDLVIDGYLLRVIDPKTGDLLPTREEYQEQLKLARREASRAKRAATKAKRESEKSQRDRDNAERQAADALHRAAELEAEIAKLRARLPPSTP